MISTIRFISLFLLLGIIAVMIYASLQQNMFKLPPVVTGNIWFQASLWDVYTGLLLFFLWCFHKLNSTFAKIIWLILLITLGNVATCAFLLWQALQVPKNGSTQQLLLNKKLWGSS